MLLPSHIRHALNELGVVEPRPARPEPATPIQRAPQDPWWLRGAECPF